MELKKFDSLTPSNEGVWFEPIDEATKKGIGLELLVLGPDSDKYVRLMDERGADSLRSVLDDKTGAKKDDRSSSEKSSDILADLTLNWRPTDPDDPPTWEGKPISFSRANVYRFYLHAASIRTQVDRFIGRRQNFLELSPKASLKPSAQESSLTGKEEIKTARKNRA